MRLSIFVVIPVHNRKVLTLQCLKKLKDLNLLTEISVVVVDDGSTDGTSDEIAQKYPDIALLSGSGQLWWTGAIEKGMRYAYEQGADYIIWLNDDCLISDRTIDHLIYYCQAHPNTIVGAQGYEKDNTDDLSFGGKESHWWVPLNYELRPFPDKSVTRCDMLSGNLVCLPKSVIEICGFPKSRAFPHYGGDTVYLQTAKKKGFQLFVDTRTQVENVYLCSSSTNIANWFLEPGHPLKILKLIGKPQSSLYWRLYWHLSWSNYNVLALPIFCYTYIPILIQVVLITLLRYLPQSGKQKLSNLKLRLNKKCK